MIILGGAGFAGSGLVKKFLAKDVEVKVIDIISPHQAYNLADVIDNPKLIYVWKALRDVEVEDLEGHDTIVHLAAQADVPMGITSPRWTIMENVEETICFLEQVRKLKTYPDRLIYAGSGNEFGRPIYLPIDEKHPLTPHNPYAFSKAAAEMAYWTYSRCYNLPITIMSNGACLGAGMRRDIFVYLWLRNMIKRLPVRLEGGTQTRDLTYVSDILDAWELVIEAEPNKIRNEKFQVSYCEEISVEQILEMCYAVTGLDVPTIRVNFRPGEEGQRELFTNQKARDILGYNPKVSPMEGIRLTYEWMKKLNPNEL
jgi:UDP-glucose 4-epimerase